MTAVHSLHICVLLASRYTGKELDAESSLDNFGARYYASSMGRFMSVDPAFESEILELPPQQPTGSG
jgi:RHS repeat-associated protein